MLLMCFRENCFVLIVLVIFRAYCLEYTKYIKNDVSCVTEKGASGRCEINNLVPLRNSSQCPENYECTDLRDVNITNTFNGDVCGTSLKFNNWYIFIVGGEPAQSGSWPWAAALGFDVSGLEGLRWLCGGSLINQRYVLTAAHCFIYSRNQLAKVRLGNNDLRTKNYGSNKFDYDFDMIILHKEFDGFKNDIALVKLKEDVKYSVRLRPVCLPGEDMNDEYLFDRTAYVIGWGKTDPFDSRTSDILRAVDVALVENFVCKLLLPHYDISETEMCAGWEGGKDACEGDSGGPLMTEEYGRWVQIGIVSRGLAACGTPGYPGIYTRLSSYLSWIQANIL